MYDVYYDIQYTDLYLVQGRTLNHSDLLWGLDFKSYHIYKIMLLIRLRTAKLCRLCASHIYFNVANILHSKVIFVRSFRFIRIRYIWRYALYWCHSALPCNISSIKKTGHWTRELYTSVGPVDPSKKHRRGSHASVLDKSILQDVHGRHTLVLDKSILKPVHVSHTLVSDNTTQQGG